MNFAEAIKDNADPAFSEPGFTRPSVIPRNAPTTWEPHEVWLTRIKIPRDCAAMEREQARAWPADGLELI